MTEQHECEWQIDRLGASCVNGICFNRLPPDEANRRLNEYEKLKRATETLRNEMEASVSMIEYLNNKLPEKERLVSSQAYADILKGGNT